jgi:hypothetical protein
MTLRLPIQLNNTNGTQINIGGQMNERLEIDGPDQGHVLGPGVDSVRDRGLGAERGVGMIMEGGGLGRGAVKGTIETEMGIGGKLEKCGREKDPGLLAGANIHVGVGVRVGRGVPVEVHSRGAMIAETEVEREALRELLFPNLSPLPVHSNTRHCKS